jgi:uncharacterized protein
VPWLVHDGKVLATLEVATSHRDRMRGLLGRERIDGALLLERARSIHTVGMRFAIDVAFCDRDLTVLRVVTMRPNRLGRPVPRARSAIEADAGSFERWGVSVGDQLEIKGGPSDRDGEPT